MKRRGFLLLICFLYLFFFVGKSDVYGLICKIGEAGCTEEAIEEELNKNGKELACLYEMTIDGGEVYYWYIYYKRAITEMNDYFKTYRNLYGVATTYRWATVVDDLFIDDNFYEQSDLKYCPKDFYVSDNGENGVASVVAPHYLFNICLEGDLECKNKNSDRSFKNSEILLVADKVDSIIFKRTDRYTKYVKDDNFCVYYFPEGVDYSWIVYSKDKNAIFFNDYSTKSRVSIGLDSSKSVNDNKYNINISPLNNSCPKEIYYAKDGSNYYFSDQYIVDDKIKDKNRRTYILWEPSKAPNNSNEVSCEIFDDNLREIINGVMDIIRIAIPLLLIGLIGVDFGKAIFASDGKAISKAKKNAITRIIIAIVIYFVPTLINLVFNIANDVWADTHYEICVLGESNNNN